LQDWGPDFAQLEWVPPEKTNGAPILKYVIEGCENGKSWMQLAESKDSKAKVPLKEGQNYEFRVFAVNKAGKSDSSPVSMKIVAKHRRLKPWIDKSKIKPIKVKVGQPVEIELNFKGEPDPTVERDTGVKIAKAERKHTAAYKLTVTNEVGEDSAEIEVVVLGKPSKPVGPLEVTDVTKTTVTLTWKGPLDTGGEDIDHYDIEKFDMAKNRWETVTQSCKKLTYEVTKLEERQLYKFRVRAVSNQGAGDWLETEAATLPDAPRGLIIKDHDRDHIDLKWEAPRSDGGAPIQGYIVERKEPKSNRWVKITKSPVPGLEFTDDAVRENKEYEYRVYAVNEAGPSEASEVSPIAVAKPSREAPKLNLNDLSILGKEIRIRAGEKLDIPIHIIGAPKPVCTWTKDGSNVSPNSDLQIVDREDLAQLLVERAKRGDTGVYKIKLKNDFGEDEAEIKVNVMDKPTEPTNFEVSDIFADHCKLSWNPPKDDGGCEITDYIVEKCDTSSGIWETVSALVNKNSVQVNNLIEGKSYQFRVRAVNMIGKSEPCETKSPTLAKNPYDAPDSPEGLTIESYDRNGVNLVWKQPKNDGGNPIQGYAVEKRRKGGDWRKCSNSLVPGTKTRVTGLEEGQEFEFRVIAVNDAGEGKPSKTSGSQIIKDPTTPPSSPEGLNVDKVNKSGALLSWNKPKSDGGCKITGYVLEAKDEKGNWVPVKQVDADKNSAFVPMKEGEKAAFRVRAINEEGEGEPSKPTAVITAENQPEVPRMANEGDGLLGGPNSGIGGLKDITLKAGQELRLCAAWFGWKPPTATWSLNDKQISSDGSKIKISMDPLPPMENASAEEQLAQSNGGQAVFLVPKARRADAGSYQLTLANELGHCTSTCNVNVIDVPGPCKGPLEPIEVKADEITLSWKAPIDDGGEPITNYVLEKKAKGSDVWLKVSGFLNTTTATVRNLDVGTEYEFRVIAENSMGRGEPLVTATAIKAKHPYDPPGRLDKPTVEDTTNDSVTLAWEAPLKGPITGYI
ncbi:hypothetical protein Ciccas_008070, partial [Cichlidogyrus casuarinus]